uniref:Uncharacterized protein n=1 Tax=Eptatretus burgeri TaxID=7764 RepID=A0A8C4QKK2_EPTBU
MHTSCKQEIEGRLKENCIMNDERDEKSQLLVPKEEDVKESVKEAEVDSKFVQINAGKAEVHIYIVRLDKVQKGSCARTDAAFTPRPGCRSHIKVSRVVNTYGPQSRQKLPIKTEIATRGCGNSAIEERLQNLEVHLQLKPGRIIKAARKLLWLVVSVILLASCVPHLIGRLNHFVHFCFKKSNIWF